MQITLTSKIQIFPDEESKRILIDTMHAYRDACNYVSDFVFSTQSLDLKVLQNNLYYNIRSKYKLKAQMTISVLRTVVTSYKAHNSRNDEWPFIRFNKPQLDLLWNRDYSISKGKISICTLHGRLKIPFDYNRLSYKGTFGTAKLVYRHNKFFLNIPVTREIPDAHLSDINCVVGIDRGVRFLATTYDSYGKTTFFSGKDYKINEIIIVNSENSLRRLAPLLQKEDLKLLLKEKTVG